MPGMKLGCGRGLPSPPASWQRRCSAPGPTFLPGDSPERLHTRPARGPDNLVDFPFVSRSVFASRSFAGKKMRRHRRTSKVSTVLAAVASVLICLAAELTTGRRTIATKTGRFGLHAGRPLLDRRRHITRGAGAGTLCKNKSCQHTTPDAASYLPNPCCRKRTASMFSYQRP